jgi:hypothetical protein
VPGKVGPSEPDSGPLRMANTFTILTKMSIWPVGIARHDLSRVGVYSHTDQPLLGHEDFSMVVSDGGARRPTPSGSLELARALPGADEVLQRSLRVNMISSGAQ